MDVHAYRLFDTRPGGGPEVVVDIAHADVPYLVHRLAYTSGLGHYGIESCMDDSGRVAADAEPVARHRVTGADAAVDWLLAEMGPCPA
jgi:hypothetical protein